MANNPIIILQGGQYGSEAKGAIAGLMCKREKVDIAVRTGATNAGHTVYYAPIAMDRLAGEPSNQPPREVAVKMQQLPVGWVNPDTELVLGAGSMIDPVILERECTLVSSLTGRDVRQRLYVDGRAGVHLSVHAHRSELSGRHHKIGATGKGCSEAIIDKIRGRGEGYRNFGDIPTIAGGYNICDTSDMLNRRVDSGAKIMLEGTQGTLLDLHLGPYPYTTHKQCGPAQWMMEAGLSPALATDIIMVVRTYPIRVAGNSGPLPREISWPMLARRINDKRIAMGKPPIVSEHAILLFELAVEQAGKQFHIPSWGKLDVTSANFQHEWTTPERVEFQEGLSEINKVALLALPEHVRKELEQLFEMTTVTKKLRRIANISWRELRSAAYQVRPHRVALTFMNYEFPDQWYSAMDPDDMVPDAMKAYTDQVRRICGGAPISYMSFGPADSHVTCSL